MCGKHLFSVTLVAQPLEAIHPVFGGILRPTRLGVLILSAYAYQKAVSVVLAELNGKVVSVAKAVDGLATDARDLDRRLVRVETIIEITRPDGGTIRIARQPPEGP